MYMHSRYMGYSMYIKSLAFIPCVIGFITFLTLIALYGRVSKEEQRNGAGAAVNQAGCVGQEGVAGGMVGDPQSPDLTNSRHSLPPDVVSEKKESISMTRLVSSRTSEKPSRQSSTDSAEPLSLKDDQRI